MRGAGGLCIADEIQAGFGRVGRRMWGFVGHDVVPDMVTLGKPMGNGHPLAAVVTTTEIAEEFARTGYYFSTFAGNPVSAAVGNAVLDVVLEPGFLEYVAQMGLKLKQQLAAIADEHSEIVAEVRGQGLMMGLQCRPQNTKLVAALRDRGLLTVPAGDNVVRLLPPLIVGEEEIDLATRTVDAACTDLKSGDAG